MMVPDQRLPTDVPVGLPVSGGGRALEAAKGRAPGQSGATKDFSPTHPSVRRPERRRGPGLCGLAELNRLLSDRDVAVLEAVSAHRFLTTRHLERLLFADHASSASGSRVCRRVLARLEAWQLVQRPLRRIGGLTAGSASSVWLVSSRGLRLLNLRAGLGAIGRVREPGERFVQHYLAIADAHLALIEAQRRGELELVGVAIEPRCWRRFTGLGGSREVLKPDLAAVTASGQFEDHWFIEIDRGTESLPTLIRQCRLYEKYRASGAEQTALGIFPRVVWVVPDDIRAAKLQAALRAARGITNELYRVTTPDRFVPLLAGGAA